VAEGIGWLIAFFRRKQDREPPPSGWALAFDAVLAVGAAGGAVYEMTQRSLTAMVMGPVPVRADYGRLIQLGPKLGMLTFPPAHASGVMLFAAALTALPLAARRFYPITVWLVIAAAIVFVHSTYVPPVALGTAVFAAYSAVTHSAYRNLAIAVVVMVTFTVTSALGPGLPRFPGRLTAIFAIVPAAVAGLGIRELRRRLADSTARLNRAAADAKAATKRALVAERARIASELHDVVTHNVSVMIVQAGAARKIMASSPSEAEDALLAVEATGREAMTELRNLLGLLSPLAGGSPAALRPAGPAAALTPQPGLGELDALIGRVAAAGLPVELRVTGEPGPLSPGADLAAYRVVQEGLTNVLRHSGRAAATVGVEWGEEILVIAVTDDGGGSGRREASSGRGLIGLRERLAIYGGELAAGPRPGGGWQLRAVIPLGAAS
jgi:signal transduction histidine kinase